MKKALLLLLMMPTMAMAQIITTIAGSGIIGFSGDGGPATAAAIEQPYSAVMDAAGNIYFSDCVNNRIRKINTSGIITTFAGNGFFGFSGDGGPASAASLRNPTKIIIDGGGNFYFSDLNNSRIRKISPAGIITTIAGSGITGFSGDGGPATAASLYSPISICLDASGNMLIADADNNRIRKITPAGIITTIAGNGIAGFGGEGGAATLATLNHPVGILTDAFNNIYIADGSNHRIRKINPSGIISTYAGTGTGGFSGDGGPASSAQLNGPYGIEFDGGGNMYIADAGNYSVRKVTAGGIISTICGTGVSGFGGDGGPATAAQLHDPTDVKFSNTGDLMVADLFNNRVRKIAMGLIVPTNHIPMFTSGTTGTLIICESEVAVPTDTLLRISDIDGGQTETWSLVTAPAHGIAAVAYSAVSTGSTITPTGLTYAPATGYVGTDLFTVKVKDGIDSSIITINVTINPLPNAGVISGVDSVCAGAMVTLTESVTGGVWGVTNTVRATVSGSGVVSGVSSGIDTVTYRVTNSCGIDTAFFPIRVRSYAACHTGVATIGVGENTIELYPNPAYSELHVTSTEMISSIVISSVTGRVMMSRNCATVHEVIDLAGLASGVYLVRINGSVVRKFVKE